MDNFEVPLRKSLTAFAFIDKVFSLFGIIQLVKHFDVFISIHVCITLFKLKTTGTITCGSIKQKPQGETRLRLNIQLTTQIVTTIHHQEARSEQVLQILRWLS